GVVGSPTHDQVFDEAADVDEAAVAVRGERAGRVQDALVVVGVDESVATVDAGLDVLLVHALNRDADTAELTLARRIRVLLEFFQVLAPHLDLDVAEIEHAHGATADHVAVRRIAEFAEQLEAKIVGRIDVPGDVADVIAVVAEGGAVDLRRAFGAKISALTLSGVEIEAHAEMVDLPALEAAELDVPFVPLPRTHPEVVGVGLGGARGVLSAVGDELDLPLHEVLVVSIRGSEPNTGAALGAKRPALGLVLSRGLQAGVARIDPREAGEPQHHAWFGAAHRHVRPLLTVEGEPERTTFDAANLQLGVR